MFNIATIILFFLFAIEVGVANAEMQVQIFAPDGTPVPLTANQVQSLDLQEGQTYSIQVMTPTTLSGTVQDLFQRTDENGITSGQFRVAPFQTTLTVGTGQNAQTFLITPQENTALFGLTTTDLIGLAVIAGIIILAIIIWRKRHD